MVDTYAVAGARLYKNILESGIRETEFSVIWKISRFFFTSEEMGAHMCV